MAKPAVKVAPGRLPPSVSSQVKVSQLTYVTSTFFRHPGDARRFRNQIRKLMSEPEEILLMAAASAFTRMGELLVDKTPKDLGWGASNWHASQNQEPTQPFTVPPRGGADTKGHLRPTNPRRGIEATLGNITVSMKRPQAWMINQAPWVAMAEGGGFKKGIMRTYGRKQYWAASKKIEERAHRGILPDSSVGGYSSQAPGGFMEQVLEVIGTYAAIQLNGEIHKKGYK